MENPYSPNSTVPASLRVRGHGPDPVPDVDRAAQRREVVHVMRVVVPLAHHDAVVAHDVLVVAEVDVVAVCVLSVVTERPDLDRPVPRARHDGLVTVVRPGELFLIESILFHDSNWQSCSLEYDFEI